MAGCFGAAVGGLDFKINRMVEYRNCTRMRLAPQNPLAGRRLVLVLKTNNNINFPVEDMRN